MMKVVILTEGGSKIGFGHITRCSALYESFEEEGIRPVFAVNSDKTAKALLTGKKVKFFNWLKKRAELSDLVSGADVVLIDSYLADLDLYRRISSEVKLPVYIDDNKRLDYPRGVIINGSINAGSLKYRPGDGVVHLLGAKYMPLRREFRDVPCKRVKAEVGRILITFGGNDPRNMTPKILKYLVRAYPRLNKIVIIGRGFKSIKEIERSKDDRTDMVYYPDARGIKKAMLRSDIAISAGGQTLFELARVGLPTIVVAAADNQINNIKWWRDAGFVDYAGRYGSKNVLPELAKDLEKLMDYRVRLKRSRSGRGLIDGKGTNRAVGKILGLARSGCKCKDSGKGVDNIRLRKAVEADSLDLLSWRNHPEARKQSFTPQEISYPEHRKWFTKKLHDKNTRLYIAEAKGIGKIGQVRFDIFDDYSARVNVNLNPGCLGKGFGSKIIIKGTRFFLKESPGIKKIIAEILDGNAISKKVFQKAAYFFSHNILKNNRKTCIYKFEN